MAEITFVVFTTPSNTILQLLEKLLPLTTSVKSGVAPVVGAMVVMIGGGLVPGTSGAVEG
jgi:hypothetical protein